mgnify:CR=1 FL=1
MDYKTISNYETKRYHFDPFIPMVGGLLAGLYIGKFGNSRKAHYKSGLEKKL